MLKILSMTSLAWEMSTNVRWLACSFILPFLGMRMRIDLFQSCGHWMVFQICCHDECKTLMAFFFRDQNSLAGISSRPLALLIAVLKVHLPSYSRMSGSGWLSYSIYYQMPELLTVKVKEAWRAAIHGVAKSRTRVSDWTEGKGKRNLYSFYYFKGHAYYHYITKNCNFGSTNFYTSRHVFHIDHKFGISKMISKATPCQLQSSIKSFFPQTVNFLVLVMKGIWIRQCQGLTRLKNMFVQICCAWKILIPQHVGQHLQAIANWCSAYFGHS